jgi:hypothetical protein
MIGDDAFQLFQAVAPSPVSVIVMTRMSNIAKSRGKFQTKCAIVLTLLLSTLGQAVKFNSISMAQ